MTARQIWEGMLTELSKINAPSMLLLDFNYFFNKAINLYINKRYNIYDINLQTTDDLRVLKATSILDVKKALDKDPLKSLQSLGAGKSKLFGATYEVDLPLDYLHILNCICIYKVNKRWKCYDAGDYVLFPAKRLTGDALTTIVNDFYNRPLPERPYYYIHNININEDIPTNPVSTTGGSDTDNTKAKYESGTDMGTKEYSVTITLGTETSLSQLSNGISSNTTSKTAPTTGTSGVSNFPRVITLSDDSTIDAVERETAQRYGNASKVRMEIRYGQK